MKLNELLEESVGRLKKKNVESPILQAESILVHVLNCSRGGSVPDNTELELTKKETARVRHLVRSRGERPPVEYFCKPVKFCGIKVNCSPRACIPRPDSEVLVDLTIRELKGEKPGVLYDVGTGVGAIALALAKQLPKWEVIGTDVTLGCLMLAHRNTVEFSPRLEKRITWEVSDLLSQVEREADCVVANLPYVRSEYLICDDGQVSAEPNQALDGGADGLDYIRNVIPQAAKISPRLFLEVGPLQSEEVTRRMQDEGYQRVEVFKDFLGRERFVFGHKE